MDIELILPHVVMAIIPIVSALVVCLLQDIWIGDVYLPASKWNDEIYIYKIIEGTVQYGHPMGYFGYNEVAPNYLTYGPWSPFIMWPQIIWGVIVGWNYQSPLICNIVLLCIAFVVLSFLIRPNLYQTIICCVLLMSFTIMSRYILSGMSETNCLFSVLLLGAGVFALYKKEKFSNGWYIYTNVILALCTLMRGYYIVFSLFIFYYLWKNDKKKLYVQIPLVILFIASYIWVSKNLCAPYLSPIIKTDWITAFYEDGIITGFKNFILITYRGVSTLVRYCLNGFFSGDTIGGCYTIYWTIGIWFFVRCFKEPIYRLWLIIWIVIQASMIYLYDIKVGSRHILVFIYLALVFISFYEKNRVVPIVICTIILLANRGLYADDYYWKLPRYNENLEKELEIGDEQIKESFCINKDNYWDNTIYYPAKDGSAIDWRLLYAIPSGMGIEYGTKEDVKEDLSRLKSKYIITNNGEQIDNSIKEQNTMSLVAEYGGVHIWNIRE